jgi:hypothetical protein
VSDALCAISTYRLDCASLVAQISISDQLVLTSVEKGLLNAMGGHATCSQLLTPLHISILYSQTNHGKLKKN